MSKEDLPFTFHALSRLAERTSISTHQLLKILTEGRFVDLGAKPGIHRRHLLIYSIPNKSHFVLIQDSLDGDFITILPLEYQTTLCWPVPDEHLHLAHVLAFKEVVGERAPQTPPTVLKISSHYLDTLGCPRSRMIAKLPVRHFGCWPDQVHQHPEFLKTIAVKATAQKIDVQSIDRLTVTLGSGEKKGHYNLKSGPLAAAWRKLLEVEARSGVSRVQEQGESDALYVGCVLGDPFQPKNIRWLGPIPPHLFRSNLQDLTRCQDFYDHLEHTLGCHGIAAAEISGVILKKPSSDEKFLVELDHLAPTAVRFVRSLGVN